MSQRRSQMSCWQSVLEAVFQGPGEGSVGRCRAGDISWETSGVPGEDLPKEVSCCGTCWKATQEDGAPRSNTLAYPGKVPTRSPTETYFG